MASEDVPALVAVGDGPRAPPGVARRELEDGPVSVRGQHRVHFGRDASRGTRTSAIPGDAGGIGHDGGGFHGHTG